jgi:CheY-like chemotaxis protein
MVATGLRRGRILVVEDDPGLRDTLIELLEAAGYEVVGAAHGAEALAHLGRGPLPDLILLNLVMPVMDGWQSREQLRQHPTLASIPVVVLSGVPDDNQAVTSLGVQDYLSKPVSMEQLLATVAQYCP